MRSKPVLSLPASVSVCGTGPFAAMAQKPWAEHPVCQRRGSIKGEDGKPPSPYGLSRQLFQLGFQFRLAVLIAGLAQQGKHVLLVSLYARLVEGVHFQQIAGQAAGVLEEVNQLA